jgi:hypothetical protein
MICSRHLHLVSDFVQAALHLLAAGKSLLPSSLPILLSLFTLLSLLPLSEIPLPPDRKSELQTIVLAIFGLPPPPSFTLTQTPPSAPSADPLAGGEGTGDVVHHPLAVKEAGSFLRFFFVFRHFDLSCSFSP